MENQGREKKRVANIIWNAAEDYAIQMDYEIYDQKGEAELYWNYVVGAAHKYYDYALLQNFFQSLQGDLDHVFYESLTWLGLESCTYARGKKDRPVLEELRRSYARKVLRKDDPPSFYYFVDEVKEAHFRRALGEEPAAREQVIQVLNELEFDETLTTEQIISRMTALIEAYFPLSPALKRRRFSINLLPRIRNRKRDANRSSRFRFPYLGTPLVSLFAQASDGASDEETGLTEQQRKNKRLKQIWQNFKDQRTKKQRAYIQGYYGRSILSEAQVLALEKLLCTDNHRICHLHLTRGDFDPDVVLRGVKVDPKKLAENQHEKNRAYYQKFLARNNTSIDRLANAIRNAMFVHLETSTYRAQAGALVAGKVWRNIYLNDSKVFLRNVVDEFGNLSVDILLDASGSQINRQEMISTEAYIIAEALTRCHIPVKVYSYCTNSLFTVMRLFRDYQETNRNEKVFDYRASGCNRDGIAVRAALHMIQDSPAEHKILIVLSDGKPLDPQGIPGHGFHPEQSIYTDAPGVNDTAAEVRKGTRDGVSVLCVFTGLDQDLPDAKKIYGNNLVRIKSPERFADMVGVLIQNVLKNL